MSTLNFGNGYIAGDGQTVIIEDGHSGLDYPTVSLPMIENAVMDGASIGTSRMGGRKMVLPLTFTDGSTRAHIAAAFSPGVERTLTAATGTMPYYVEDCIFAGCTITGDQRIRLVIASPLACPEGATLTATIEGSGWGAAGTLLSYATTNGYDQLTELGRGQYEVGKGTTFTLAAPKRVTSATLYMSSAVAHETWLCEARLHTKHATLALPGALVASAISMITTTTSLVAQTFTFDAPVELAAGDYTVSVHSLDAISWWNELRFATDTGKGFTGGAAFTATSEGVDVFYEVDSTADLKFVLTGSSLEGDGESDLLIDADTDVPAAPVITCTFLTGSDDLIITGADWTTTIHGPFVANDVVVVDSRQHTVLINNADSISKFERSGDWPSLDPGMNAIAVAPAVAVSVSWKPRRLGLI